MIDTRKALFLAFAVLSTTPPALTQAKAESQYPTATRDGRERFQRTGTCPTGYVGVGAFCEALHADTPHAFPVFRGKACPAGTFRSGDSCKTFR
jgi:hypothetical protein